MNILGIETTCDETGIAIVKDGVEVVKNVVVSSSSFHKKFGGIVPEIAAREQVKVIIPAIKEVIGSSKSEQVDAIAVASGPGLIGSLLIGVETAKTLALVWNKPLIAVNHLVAHIYANWLSRKTTITSLVFPFIALVVSGAHTDLLFFKNHEDYKWLGGSVDDATGEAFDKVARVLGLTYPGGPQVEKLAKLGDPMKFNFPKPMINSGDFDFSFSGLKTAVINQLNKIKMNDRDLKNIAASFQKSIVDVLVFKTVVSAKNFNVKSIAIGGGVAANLELRNNLAEAANKFGIKVYSPKANFSVDNGAMVASAAFFSKKYVDPRTISADPGLYFS